MEIFFDIDLVDYFKVLSVNQNVQVSFGGEVYALDVPIIFIRQANVYHVFLVGKGTDHKVHLPVCVCKERPSKRCQFDAVGAAVVLFALTVAKNFPAH